MKRRTNVYAFGSLRSLSRKGAAQWLRDNRKRLRSGEISRFTEKDGSRTYWHSPATSLVLA